MADELRITSLRHPYWTAMGSRWQKWRLCYCGGEDFAEEYIEKFSEIEDSQDFKRRKRVAPYPSFAKSVLKEVRNSIFQRMSDVTRRGGSEAYQAAVQGRNNGVDLHGKTMDQFLGTDVLDELLPMARVGIFVDQPQPPGPTLADQAGKMTPYLYLYKTEEIHTWSYRRDRADEFQSVLLCDYVDQCCPVTHMPNGQWKRWRYCFLEGGVVHVRFYGIDENGKEYRADMEGNPSSEEYIINLPFIPFVISEISESLLTDVSNHQVALVNLESSDIAYCMKANVPIYTEQDDGRSSMMFQRGPSPLGDNGTAEEAAFGRDKQVKVGVTQGRRYGPGMHPPEFIHPSPEPLLASMQKQKNLKDDIRQLINLSLSNIKPKMASAESKAIDERGLEAGLSYIGLVLEHTENKIAKYWAAYEGSDPATIAYPKNYSLQSDDDRNKQAEALEEHRDAIPSITYQKAVSKRIVDVMMGGKESTETLDQIKKEIDEAPTITAAIEHVLDMVKAGIMSKALAEKVLNLPEGTVEQADKEHADRLAEIAKHQAKPDLQNQNPAARGNPDASADPEGDAAAEKENRPKRGEGKE